MPRRQSTRALTIGAVLAQVRDEFPDVTISKIRFLEAEGLIQPERTPSGYRVFRAEDVERLRYILRAQRDQFWPLKVIREALDALERGLEPSSADGHRPQAPPPREDPDAALPRSSTSATTVRLTRSELATSAGIAPSELDEMVTHGLLHADATGHFDDNAQRVVHAVTALSAHGLGPRHLRPFRTAADREIGLVEQAVAGRPPARRADDTDAVAALCLQLHAALLRSGLDRR